MKENIIYPIKSSAGKKVSMKIVPDTVPGINGRMSITGVFRIFQIDKLKPLAREIDMDANMVFKGNIRFLNENFFEWRYEGQGLGQEEIVQLVKIIQDDAESWLDKTDHSPVLQEKDLNDPESALYMSDEQLAAIMEHPLYDIAPNFLFGPHDLVIGIVQNDVAFDIHINGIIAANLEVSAAGETQVISGSIPDTALLTEIVRRIIAVRGL
ncbi:hypothetical protein [Mucilaginibacter sp.]|uniref:hypothetical protein n=1 Tax=Mucilaginibacter sp. TaxID=1882438 RepID=UPI00374CC8AE